MRLKPLLPRKILRYRGSGAQEYFVHVPRQKLCIWAVACSLGKGNDLALALIELIAIAELSSHAWANSQLEFWVDSEVSPIKHGVHIGAK